jgi:hypothetical protein
MNELRIHIEGNYSDIADVTIPVEIIDGNLERIAERTLSLFQQEIVSVPGPGRYLVRAFFPSGEWVSTTVTVPDGDAGEPPVALLRPREVSQHETLAWAYTAQGLKRVAGITRRQASEKPSRLLAHVRSFGPETPGAEFAATYQIAEWNAADGFWKFQRLDSLTVEAAEPDPEDQRVILRGQLTNPEWAGGDSRQWRPCYQSFRQGKAPENIPLFAVPPGPRTDMLLVEADDTPEPSLRPMVRGNNPQADAILAYLNQGAFEAARNTGDRLIEQMDSLLGGKVSDPTSAIVAGYCMLKASSIRHEDWLENLANWFPGLPDGAIICGWGLLYQNPPDQQAARDYFLMAARRGIPMYTVGLRMLMDGLKFCRSLSEGDGEIRQALQAVRRVADNADWKADVTSFSLPTSDLKTDE